MLAAPCDTVLRDVLGFAGIQVEITGGEFDLCPVLIKTVRGGGYLLAATVTRA